MERHLNFAEAPKVVLIDKHVAGCELKTFLHRSAPAPLVGAECLEEAFAEGITTGHPTMPEFRFEPDQVANLIAFLKSLE